MGTNSTILLGFLSVLLFGLRHGIDYDHVAAITDLTSGESSPRRAMKLGLNYALGHAAVVLVLGSLAVISRVFLPKSIDGAMERIVGVTLIVLGIYVVVSLFRTRHNHNTFRIQSRFMLLARWLKRATRRKSVEPLEVSATGTRSAFVIGLIHGVGAETPTQLGLFLFAAGVGGRAMGLLGVLLFVIGLLISNTVMCALSVGMFRVSTRRDLIFRGIASLTAVYSLVVGVIFLFGSGASLPPLQ